MSEVVLKEAAMVRVGNTRIGCGNLWEREYTLPDRTPARGMTARIVIGETVLDVGVGSELVVEGVRYRVTAIDKQPTHPGRVHLEPIQDGAGAANSVSRGR